SALRPAFFLLLDVVGVLLHRCGEASRLTVNLLSSGSFGRLGVLNRLLLSASGLLALLFGLDISGPRVLLGGNVGNGQRGRTLGALDFSTGFLRGNLQGLLARVTMEGNRPHGLTPDKGGNGNARLLARRLRGAPCSEVASLRS